MIAPIQLAKDGPTFSRLVFGVMKWGIWGHNLTPQEVAPLISESVEMGVTTFDHADIYGHYTTEALFGAAMRTIPALRQKMQLVTKCGIKMLSPNRPSHQLKSYDTSKAHILQSVENSLRFFTNRLCGFIADTSPVSLDGSR